LPDRLKKSGSVYDGQLQLCMYLLCGCAVGVLFGLIENIKNMEKWPRFAHSLPVRAILHRLNYLHNITLLFPLRLYYPGCRGFLVFDEFEDILRLSAGYRFSEGTSLRIVYKYS
jgi:hypothetical protein